MSLVAAMTPQLMGTAQLDNRVPRQMENNHQNPGLILFRPLLDEGRRLTISQHNRKVSGFYLFFQRPAFLIGRLCQREFHICIFILLFCVHFH